MAGQKRSADDYLRWSSTFVRRGPASSVGMPNLHLVVLTSDALLDGREASVSAITKLFEATNKQVGYDFLAPPPSFGFEPQFPAGSGGNTSQTETAPNGMPLLRVPSQEEILRALGRGPKYIHDVLFELGLNPTRANEGYMPPRNFVVPPSTVNTHIRTSPNGRIRSRNLLSTSLFNEASRNLPMVQQYIDLLGQEQYRLYSGAKAFLDRCNGNNIPVLVITDHQLVVSRTVKDACLDDEHIAMVMGCLTDSLHRQADFHRVFGEEIVTRFEINSLPAYRHCDLRAQIATGAGSPGGRRAGDEHKPDTITTKEKEVDTNPSGDISMGDALGADTATTTDTRADVPVEGPITVDDTPEPPTITVTDSADTTSATTTDQDNATKSKGKRPELESLKITDPASSQGAQPRTPIREDPHTPTQPSGSFYSETPDTPQTPTQRQLRRRAESPTTPTPPQGSRAHPRANMDQPTPTSSTPSHAPRVNNTPATSEEVYQPPTRGSWLRSALGLPPVSAPPPTRPVQKNKASTNTMPLPPRPRANIGKDILMASSTPLHLQVIGQLIGAKKVWIKNHPGLQPRPRDQLPAHQDSGLLTLNTITELGDYLFGEEDPLEVNMDMMDVDIDVDDMEIFQFSASAAAASAGPPSLLPSGSGADKGKGKAVVNLDGDSDDDVEILEVREFLPE